MAGKYLECIGYPGHGRCTLVFSAVSGEELLQAVIQHAVTVHGYEDTPELRERVRKGMKNANPRPGRISRPKFRNMFRKEVKKAELRPGRISPPEFREMIRKEVRDASRLPGRISPPKFREMVRTG
jgi:Protein of unknown function (DUF1059)